MKPIKTCKRCGRKYSITIPKIKQSGKFLHDDIATDDYCANCNRVVMSAVYRDACVYFDKEMPLGGLDPTTQKLGSAISYSKEENENMEEATNAKKL